MANAARQAADVAKSMLVTAWNLAIAGGGLIGGVLLGGFGVTAFPAALLVLLVLLVATLLVAWAASKHGFPAAVEAPVARAGLQ